MAVYRTSGRRVRGEDDKIPPIKTVAPDLPLDLLRCMDIRVDPWSAPTCAPPNALRIRPANASTSGAHVSRSDVPSSKGLGPCPRHRIATRARICSTDFYIYACGGLEDGAKIAKYSDEWYLSPPHRVGKLVRKAGAHRYLSFDAVTEHIVSEMRLILRCDKGKAGVFCRACLDLPSAACPPPARPPTPEWRGLAWPAPKPMRKPGAALLACSRAGPTHRLSCRRRRG
jgi:hypothetical protein